jgi:hypothetical protein
MRPKQFFFQNEEEHMNKETDFYCRRIKEFSLLTH